MLVGHKAGDWMVSNMQKTSTCCNDMQRHPTTRSQVYQSIGIDFLSNPQEILPKESRMSTLLAFAGSFRESRLSREGFEVILSSLGAAGQQKKIEK